jgi:stage II sporulation protein M
MTMLIPKNERLRYCRKLRPFLAVSIALFIAGAALGTLAAFYAPQVSVYFNQNVADFVKLFRALPKLQLAAAIFLNNALKSLLVVLGGIAFGLFPVIFLFANGAALGLVLSASMRSRGVLPALAAILPHGIFELPAIFLATSMGLLLGSSAIKRLFGRTDISIRSELGLALKFFSRVIVPLLLIAAIVEAFLTSVVVTITNA